MNQSQYPTNHLNKFWILLISLMGFNQLAMANLDNTAMAGAPPIRLKFQTQ